MPNLLSSRFSISNILWYIIAPNFLKLIADFQEISATTMRIQESLSKYQILCKIGLSISSPHAMPSALRFRKIVTCLNRRSRIFSTNNCKTQICLNALLNSHDRQQGSTAKAQKRGLNCACFQVLFVLLGFQFFNSLYGKISELRNLFDIKAF